MSDKKSGGIAGFGIGFGKQGDASPPQQNEDRAPFRVLVVAELTAKKEASTAASPPEEALSCDKLSLDRLMSQLAPSFVIEVPDPLVAEEAPLRIDLRFAESKAMRPDALVEQVPVLRALLSARNVVQQVAERRMTAEAARTQLTRILPRASWAEQLTREVGDARAAAPSPAAAVAKPDAGGSALDSLLSQVEMPRAEAVPVPMPPPDTTPHQATDLIAAVARSARGETRPAPVVGKAPEKVERAFQRILHDVLQHPQVRRLEESWRGLKLFVDRADHRAGVEIDVLSAEADDVEAALLRMAERRGNESERAPVDLIVVDHTVSPNAAELDRLARWAAVAAAMRAPLLVNGTPAMVGEPDLPSMITSKRRLTDVDEPRAVLTRALSTRDESRWIAIVLNRFVARLPYTAQSSRVRDITIEESANDRGAIVFAGGVWIVAALAAASYVRVGWPCMLAGGRNGIVDNLPVYEMQEKGGHFALPLESLANTEAQGEAARAGLTLLSCAANRDDAVLSRAPVLYRGKSHPAGEPVAEGTLADQLFIGRVANAIEQLAAAIPAGTDSGAASEVARLALAELFAVASAPRAPEVSARVDAKKNLLEVTIRPHGFVDVGLEEFTLGAPLGT